MEPETWALTREFLILYYYCSLQCPGSCIYFCAFLQPFVMDSRKENCQGQRVPCGILFLYFKCISVFLLGLLIFQENSRPTLPQPSLPVKDPVQGMLCSLGTCSLTSDTFIHLHVFKQLPSYGQLLVNEICPDNMY